MGLDFKKWILEKLGADKERVTVEEITAGEAFGLSAELYVRELAFWSCVNTIAGAVSKCEFKTFRGGEMTRGPEWYTWNLSPNKNQSSSTFLHKLIAKLCLCNEALIVEEGGQLLVADSFTRKPYAIYDDVFTQVQIGDFSFQKSFAQSEVLYFKRAERDMRQLSNGLYAVYQKLIDYGMRSYKKSRGSKGVITIDTVASGGTEFKDAYAALKNGEFKAFAEAENAVLPLYRGMNYTDLGSKTYSNEGTRDIKAMIDDVSDFTAKAFGVPPALLRGDVQGTADAMEHFLTFCIDPLCDMLQEEINRKRYLQSDLLRGDCLKIDTKCIKHVDLLSVSAAIDKLIASGAFCVNDIRALVGEPEIHEPWASQHFMTKNYATVADLLAALGETGG